MQPDQPETVSLWWVPSPPPGELVPDHPPIDLTDSLVRFVCPRCTRASSHPCDRRFGWCGACNDYTADPDPSVPCPGVES